MVWDRFHPVKNGKSGKTRALISWVKSTAGGGTNVFRRTLYFKVYI
jgi:hypothetical protein